MLTAYRFCPQVSLIVIVMTVTITIPTLHHGLGLGWVFFGLGQNGLGLGWVWVGFNPVKLLKIHYEDLKSKERKKYY